MTQRTKLTPFRIKALSDPFGSPKPNTRLGTEWALRFFWKTEIPSSPTLRDQSPPTPGPVPFDRLELGHGTPRAGGGRGGVDALLLTRKAKALLLPILGLIDSSPNDLLHQILRVGAVDAVRILYRTVRHFRTPSVLLPSTPLVRHIQVKKKQQQPERAWESWRKSHWTA